MNTHRHIVPLFLAAILAAGTIAVGLEIPLTVSETSGGGRRKELVSFGVPLPPGQCSNLDSLRILDDKGKEVPSLFRELSRWWLNDNSLRWVLVDFQTGIPGCYVSN